MKSANWKPKLRKFAVVCFASGFFSGYVPLASGTAGSLVAVGILWWLRAWPAWVLTILSVASVVGAVWVSGLAGKIFKEVDSSKITIDEVVGIFITMLGIPLTGYWLLVGFLLFRFFDVAKFPPANTIDAKVKNGFGVVMDDVVAGIYSNILLHLMLRAQF